MSARRVTAWLCASAIALLVSACASAPPVPPPEWATAPPPDTYEELSFVASGENRRAAAEKTADAVVGRLALGARADLTAGPVAEFHDQVRAEAAGELGADVAGFVVEERGTSRSNGETTQWIRSSFDREAFETVELSLARRVPDGNPGPPLVDRGRRRVEEGALTEALRDYGRAVVETAGTPYADDTLTEALRATRDVVSRVSVSAERDEVETRVGSPFEEPLIAQVRDTARGVGIEGMPVVITYPERTDAGLLERRRLYSESGEDGLVSFTPPVPRVRGDDAVRVALAPFFDLVTPSREPEELVRLTEVVRAAAVDLEYRAFSRAAEIPTAVFVVDTDIAGNPTGRMSTQRGLLSGFDERGFSAAPLPFDPQRFLELAEPDRLSLVRQRFDGEYQRVVLGTASITEFEETGSVSVEVGAEVRVLELDTGDELYRTAMVQRSRGNTASSAISAAFRGLGMKLAGDLAVSLP
jgi:hypothetical protein